LVSIVTTRTRVAFLHPKGLGGVLVELCEARGARGAKARRS